MENLTIEDLKIISDVLVQTPTKNLMQAQKLINIAEKIRNLIEKDINKPKEKEVK